MSSLYGRYVLIDNAKSMAKYYAVIPHPSNQKLALIAYGNIGSAPVVKTINVTEIKNLLDVKKMRGYIRFTTDYYVFQNEVELITKTSKFSNKIINALLSLQSSSLPQKEKIELNQNFTKIPSVAEAASSDYFANLNSF